MRHLHLYRRAAFITVFWVMSALAAYSTYRVIAIDTWLGQVVATRKDEAGQLVPLNRADALAYFLSLDVVAAHAKEPR